MAGVGTAEPVGAAVGGVGVGGVGVGEVGVGAGATEGTAIGSDDVEEGSTPIDGAEASEGAGDACAAEVRDGGAIAVASAVPDGVAAGTVQPNRREATSSAHAMCFISSLDVRRHVSFNRHSWFPSPATT